ncbi:MULTISPECIES: ABC transporter substrate-binding protein [Bacillaceae]|uniref:ABC transporter substrate-binding protein n=1 Tax=Bacillus infantis NRRL B-14911 TaxID=1367477 RepID=U5L6T0_9BACI|nr:MULTISPECIES: ABC transporter substrate-binding protein [Bacillus]OXT14684.1 ABC transporter substrate-binding protein [Bacillus sp. OG2]AGX03115.1 ABC transporter substrate-binding protein [Bacillus infantis NRRL B-14911]MCP1157347.1 ABC transporter substrate-binding protein [Bacillus infantis]MDT0163004.1 ABC transporter substrate-binding protein [Bacillus sp. AG4(2022)]MDW2877237.1 ABC transporter substrate-binding protein [Bacillus infantis]
MKRLLLICLSLLFTFGILAGCSSGSTSGTDDKEGTKDTGEETVTLNLFQFKVEIADQLQEMITEFEAEHPNIKVKLETVGGGADYGAALKAKFASGEQPDIFNNGGFKELELWKEHLADLSNEPWVEHLLPIGKVPMTDTDGKLYGMPVNLEGYGFVYNKDLFEKAGIKEPPANITELKDAAEKLKDSGTTPFSAGYGEWWVIGQHLLNIPFAQQEDPIAFIEGLYDGTEKFTDNEQFKQFKEVLDTEINFGNDNPLTTDYNTQVTQFAAGQTAMLQQGNWTENMIYEVNPDMNMGFLPIPISDDKNADRLPVGVPNNWVLNKNSEHLDEAKLFLEWMVSSDTGKRYLTEEFAFIPAFDNIEASGLGDLGQSILEYSKEEKTIPWTWFRWPDGANKEFAASIQEYAAGKIDYDTLLERFQKTWDNLK